METPLDHFFNDRIDPENFNALTCGPLAVHLKAYAQELYDQGYAVQTAQLQLRMLGKTFVSRKNIFAAIRVNVSA
jgi:hypothetical protein